MRSTSPSRAGRPAVGWPARFTTVFAEASVRNVGTIAARSSEESKVTRNDLLAAIRQKQKQNPEQAVVIAADKDVRYEAVLEVMDMLQSNQVRRVGLLAKPRGG